MVSGAGAFFINWAMAAMGRSHRGAQEQARGDERGPFERRRAAYPASQAVHAGRWADILGFALAAVVLILQSSWQSAGNAGKTTS